VVLASLTRLGVGLQAVAQLAQQPGDRPEADLMAELAQALGEPAHALGRPAQRLLGVAPAIAVNEALQIGQQRRILLDQALAASARPAHAARLKPLTGLQLAQSLADRRLRDSCRPRDRCDPAAPARARLGRRPQPPPTLIELGGQRPEPFADRSLIDHTP
jgi:hypothetical protein